MPVCGRIVQLTENKYLWHIMTYTHGMENEDFFSPEFLVYGVKTKIVFKMGTKDVEKVLCLSSDTSNTINLHNYSLILSDRPHGNLITIKVQGFVEMTIACEFRKSPEFEKPREKILCNTETHKIFLDINRDPKFERELENLLDSGNFTDLVIVVGESEYPVHKSILSARSKVFTAMLEDYTKESKESKIKMEDIDAKTMKAVLEFIYTGKVRDIEKMAYDLVAPADKYQLEGLLEICEKILISNISVENIKPMLTLINLYDLRALKRRAFRILRVNPGLMADGDLPDLLKKLCPSLLTEILVAFAEQMAYVNSMIL